MTTESNNRNQVSNITASLDIAISVADGEARRVFIIHGSSDDRRPIRLGLANDRMTSPAPPSYEDVHAALFPEYEFDFSGHPLSTDITFYTEELRTCLLNLTFFCDSALRRPELEGPPVRYRIPSDPHIPTPWRSFACLTSQFALHFCGEPDDECKICDEIQNLVDTLEFVTAPKNAALASMLAISCGLEEPINPGFDLFEDDYIHVVFSWTKS